MLGRCDFVRFQQKLSVQSLTSHSLCTLFFLFPSKGVGKRRKSLLFFLYKSMAFAKKVFLYFKVCFNLIQN